jgi:hypothetical protein
MTQTIDNQLIFEVLKKIQADVSVIKADLADVKAMQLGESPRAFYAGLVPLALAPGTTERGACRSSFISVPSW